MTANTPAILVIPPLNEWVMEIQAVSFKDYPDLILIRHVNFYNLSI